MWLFNSGQSPGLETGVSPRLVKALCIPEGLQAQVLGDVARAWRAGEDKLQEEQVPALLYTLNGNQPCGPKLLTGEGLAADSSYVSISPGNSFTGSVGGNWI